MGPGMTVFRAYVVPEATVRRKGLALPVAAVDLLAWLGRHKRTRLRPVAAGQLAQCEKDQQGLVNGTLLATLEDPQTCKLFE